MAELYYGIRQKKENGKSARISHPGKRHPLLRLIGHGASIPGSPIALQRIFAASAQQIVSGLAAW
jgi:hypothetical protein